MDHRYKFDIDKLNSKLFGENPYIFCIANKSHAHDYNNSYAIGSGSKAEGNATHDISYSYSILNFISEKCYSLLLKLKNELNFLVEYPKEKSKPLVITCIDPISILSDDFPDKGKILSEVKLPKWKFFRKIYYHDPFIEWLCDLINPVLSKGIYVRKFEITEDELIKYYENRLE